MPSISATCATVSISLVCFFLLMNFIKRRFQGRPCSCSSYVVMGKSLARLGLT
jgi:hypothetical protein